MKVAILGYGKEGRSALRYFRERAADITVFDEQTTLPDLPDGVSFVGGKDAFLHVDGFDTIVRTPAIRPDRIKHHGGVLTGVTELFFDECPARIIGVTGTKGKGTTSSLIFEMLKNAGEGVHLAGNIGVPALDILPDTRVGDIVVLELSSFQLWHIKKSPQVAVVLMIEPDHMDVHSNMDDYISAKANIARWQDKDDVIIFHPSNKHSAFIANQSKGKHLQYMKSPAAHVKNDYFVIDDQKICSTRDLLIPGKHNIENACAAITAAWQFTHNTVAIAEALATFKGLEHRLEKVRELHGVTYYNDSFSSALGASMAAMDSFENPEIVIIGGYDKNVDFNELATFISTRKNIKKVLLIGQTKVAIAKLLSELGFKKFEIITDTDFKSIIEHAQELASSGDVVLLSPGCASYDMFKNFYERGTLFKKHVMELR